MNPKMISVTILGKTREYPYGTSYGEIVEEYKESTRYPIVLVMKDGKLCELHKKLKRDGVLEFITTGDEIGHKTYKRSASLLLLKAIYHVAGHKNIKNVILHYSVDAGYYYTIEGDVDITEEFLASVKTYMLELVERKIPIRKRSVGTNEAIELFHEHGMYDKEKLFRFRRVSRVNIYSLDGFEDYFYGFMVNHTGYLKHFELYPYDNGLVLQLPSQENPEEVPPFCPRPKIFQVQKESEHWGEMMQADTVGALNEQIVQKGANQLLLIAEALQESKISQIARTIAENKDKKFIMIAGPSSSGKTTFSHRLSVQLAAHGLKPHPIAVDNYFVNREDTPLDSDGNYNFECLEAIDVKKFNDDMVRLLDGEEVELPYFNFKTGLREYRGNYLKLGKDDVLVIEGIHCLNDKLSSSLPTESKFKIYISALTQLNIDEHNRIPTTDGRLIRRIVRDARTRGASAKQTIAMWNSVRRGEEENIFPYQESADVMFNSALIYELAVLKLYAEPLLFSIGKEEPEYNEAKRLLKFLDYFLGVPSESIPSNSILREFVGGGCFDL
ncbi:MAG: nucleoside kinase [Blautia sp.]|uniref:nucleoside kinase n=1 Tax=Blautia sp. TaxID=1955243 RepID=UPI0024230AD9|nr:nucleoside kinase [Blautia sp.]MBS6160447.1 nucleoside kinase [Bacillota bacterium]MEE1444484.1 nucleoside kinase [Blautia sp.]